MNAIILSIGDELTFGQTVDTNSAWISQQLAAVGCDILAHMTVPDDQPGIEKAIRESAARSDVLLISGGIGPTADDLTRQALAAVMGVELEMNSQWLATLLEFFKARGRAMPETNKVQAMIPRGATMLNNSCGTAAGMRAVLRGADTTVNSPACDVFVMPGVPKEMKAMFLADALPLIRQKSGGAVILSRTLHTFGLGESWVAERLGDLMKRNRNPSVGTTVSNGIVSLRLNARFASLDEANQQMTLTVQACEAALGNVIFGSDGKTLPEVVAEMLLEKGKSVTTAESCTGGLLGKMLTDVPGSSGYFTTGWITYANESKHRLLGVSPALLAESGAVSEPVVEAMARGAKERSGADFALAISGVAGPGGGTAAKPVGTVCLALASEDETILRTFNFPGDREMIRDRSAKMALTLLRYKLLGQRLPF